MLALVLGTWSAYRAETITFDTATFIRFASQLSHADWWDSAPAKREPTRQWFLHHSPLLAVLDHHAQHPGFAVSMAGVRPLVNRFVTDDEHAWVVAAHIVSLLGFMMMVVGVYVFGREWLGEGAGLVGALLTVVSPPLVRIAADGLSDAPSAAFFIWSAYFFVRFLRQDLSGALACGCVAAGLGYLFRPEAIQLALLVVAGLAGAWLLKPWDRARLAKLSMAAGILALFVLPYVMVKGSPLTKKSYLLDPMVLRSMRTPALTEPSKVPTSNEKRPASLPSTPTAPEQAETGPPPPAANSSETIPAASASSPPSIAAPSPTPEPAGLPRYIPAIDLRPERYRQGLAQFLLLWSSLLAHSAIGLIPFGLIVALKSRPIRLNRLAIVAMMANFLLLPAVLYCACGYLDVRHVVPTFLLSAPLAWPGAVALCEAVRQGCVWLSFQWRGHGIHWPMSTEWATALTLAPWLLIIGVVTMTFRSNQQVAGLRSMGEWMQARVPPHAIVIDPGYVTAFYAGLERTNRWPYVGNLSAENLVDILNLHRDTSLVVLSDRQAKEMLQAEHWPTEMGEWRLQEIHSEPISSRPDDLQRVRLFEVHPKSSSHTAETNSAPLKR
jgi:hypothetical protein